ncbi:uncharacterized protein LOC105189384 [Harpegnathos saltator]|uniref:uncharacterized protein LOC105189384 n=1 Tax=Harpegnathos saltator TaxID=610380 RepID=UPI00058DA09C|nr:uncharacterized protein LOC105189384 [Harpegnathos saltator]
MERLILLLLSPAVFAEWSKINDPNNEPFLPIYSTYPYSPKLIKRGVEQEVVPQLAAESFKAPKEDAKDTYSTSYSSNYQRDSYYNPSYDPYPKNASPLPNYNPYYNEDAYAYPNSPYATYNPYPMSYTMSPTASSYPDYYYQPSYYYPHYFNHALFPSSPPSPTLSPPSSPSSEDVDYHETSQDAAEAEDDKQDKDKKSKKSNEYETNHDASAGQLVDDGNYISGSTRDLDGQSSTYKTASPYNQLEQDMQTKNLLIPLPKTTYRVISVAGQPVGPDYPLPAQYANAQQVEQLVSQTLTTLLAQQQAQQQPAESYENNRDTPSAAKDGSYVSQDTYNPSTPSYVAVPAVRNKTVVTYVINSDGITKVNGDQTNTQLSSFHTTSSKNAKYPSNLYVQKPLPLPDHSRTTLDLPQGTYVPQRDNRSKHRNRVMNSRPTDQVIRSYDSYDASQSYTDTLSQPGSKQERNYRKYQRPAGSHQNKDFVAAPQTPRTTYSYQYSAYESDQTSTAQQPQQDSSVSSYDGNFGIKDYNKG